MRRRVLEVELNRHASLIRGWGSRELYVEIKGSAPVYVPGDPGGWSCQEETARSIVALAEHRGYDVIVTGRRRSAETSTTRPASPREEGLGVDHPDIEEKSVLSTSTSGFLW